MGKRRSKKRSKNTSSKSQLHKSARSTGLIAGIFTLIQAMIWIILVVVGLICFFLKPIKNPLAAEFSQVYFGLTNKSSPAYIVKPIIFFCILILYLILSFLWLIASVKFVAVLKNWRSKIISPKVRSRAKFWMCITLLICIVDVIAFVLFVLDYVHISKSQGLSLFHGRDWIVNEEVTIITSRDDLIKNIKEQRNKIKQLKNRIKQLRDAEDAYEATMHGEIASINPFLGRKKSQRVHWPSKKNYQNSTSAVSPDKDQKQINKMENRLQKVLNAGDGNRHLRLPSLILLTIAFRGFLVWIINVILLTCFSSTFKKLSVKSRSFFNKIFNCFQGLGSKKKRRKSSKKKKRRR